MRYLDVKILLDEEPRMSKNSFNAKKNLDVAGKSFEIFIFQQSKAQRIFHLV